MSFLDKLLGRNKETAGDVTDDVQTKAEGMYEEGEGAAKDAADQAGDRAQEAGDAASGAAERENPL